MNLKQGLAVALIQTIFTILIAGLVFAHTWGRVEQKLITLTTDVKSHNERILYLERQK